MAQGSPLVGAVTRELRKYPSLDPRAVLAIAGHEGLSGGIGDNGTSFGPFQLHEGGAYPASAPQQPSAANEWAWSPAGIDYALNRIAQVAGGKTGLAAISAISRQFERPADPASEITDAARRYGLAPLSAHPAQGGAPSLLAAAAQPQPDPAAGRRAFARALLGAFTPKGLISPQGLAAAFAARDNA